MQDAAGFDVFEFVLGIDAAEGFDGFGFAVGEFDLNVDHLAGFEVCHAFDGDLFRAIDAVGLPAFTILKREGQDAHADEVGAVDTLEALSDHSAHAEQFGAFCRPVAGGASAVFFTSKHHKWSACGLVFHAAS